MRYNLIFYINIRRVHRVALLKFLKGNANALPSTSKEGWIYVTQDTADMYIFKTDTERIHLNANYANKLRENNTLNTGLNLGDVNTPVYFSGGVPAKATGVATLSDLTVVNENLDNYIKRPPAKNTPQQVTPNAIARWENTEGELKNSSIIIENVINERTNSTVQTIAIPASGSKKIVYGQCTDQSDGTSFIGGLFSAGTTKYPYAEGLAIGGTSGNLLWKGQQVATTDMIKPAYSSGLQISNNVNISNLHVPQYKNNNEGLQTGVIAPPAIGGGSTKFFREDGNWVNPFDTTLTYVDFGVNASGGKPQVITGYTTGANGLLYNITTKDITYPGPPSIKSSGETLVNTNTVINAITSIELNAVRNSYEWTTTTFTIPAASIFQSGLMTAEDKMSLDGKANKSTSQTITLTASGWSNNSQTVSISKWTASTNGICSIAANQTASVVQMAQKSGIFISDDTQNGQLTFSYFKSQPTADIKMTIIMLG